MILTCVYTACLSKQRHIEFKPNYRIVSPSMKESVRDVKVCEYLHIGHQHKIHFQHNTTVPLSHHGCCACPALQVRMWLPSSKSNDALDSIHNEALSSDSDTRLLPEILLHLLLLQYNWIHVCFICLSQLNELLRRWRPPLCPRRSNHLYY